MDSNSADETEDVSLKKERDSNPILIPEFG